MKKLVNNVGKEINDVYKEKIKLHYLGNVDIQKFVEKEKGIKCEIDGLIILQKMNKLVVLKILEYKSNCILLNKDIPKLRKMIDIIIGNEEFWKRVSDWKPFETVDVFNHTSFKFFEKDSFKNVIYLIKNDSYNYSIKPVKNSTIKEVISCILDTIEYKKIDKECCVKNLDLKEEIVCKVREKLNNRRKYIKSIKEVSNYIDKDGKIYLL